MEVIELRLNQKDKPLGKGLVIDSEARKNVKQHTLFEGNVLPLLKTYQCSKSPDLLILSLSQKTIEILKSILKEYKPKAIIASGFKRYEWMQIAFTYGYSYKIFRDRIVFLKDNK
jgi:hypothetical protein